MHQSHHIHINILRTHIHDTEYTVKGKQENIDSGPVDKRGSQQNMERNNVKSGHKKSRDIKEASTADSCAAQ